jgi:prepilin-type N-terminal cleavage/methylation domain-containing protein
MKTHRDGFTLVELLIVTVLGGILMAAAYQTLIGQERAFRTTGEMIRGQDGLRTAMGVLEAELREAASNGSAIGAPDILAATRDSVVVRAQRRMGFVCSVGTSDKHAITRSLSDLDHFDPDEALLIFADGVLTTAADDYWVAARVNGTPQAVTTACTPLPGSPSAHQRINLKAMDGSDLDGAVLADVRPGAPIRSVQLVTYGLYQAGNDWFLGRRRGTDQSVERLVAGLGGPGQGVVFMYMDADGNTLLQPVNPASVAAIRVTARTAPPAGSGASPVSLTSHVHLRNN